jgi:hypothetical protein
VLLAVGMPPGERALPRTLGVRTFHPWLAVFIPSSWVRGGPVRRCITWRFGIHQLVFAV